MANIISLPKLGFNMDNGQIVEWHKAEGEMVTEGEPLFDMHTDKTVITIDATSSGTLLKILAKLDEDIPVFTPIAVMGEPGENIEDTLISLSGSVEKIQSTASGKSAKQKEPDKCKAEASDLPENIKLTPKAKALVKQEQYALDEITKLKGSGFKGGITAKDILASPLARKMANDMGVELNEISGSGPQNKIIKSDVIQAAESKSITDAEAGEKKIAGIVSYSGIRKIIGDRLSQSKFTAPHLYFTEEVDTTNLTAFRRQLNDASEENISMSALLIMVASNALRKFPDINASLIDNQIITYTSTNVGIAVAGSCGLIVPVVKNVQNKTLRIVAKEVNALVERAKAGRLSPEEYSGGTFTISNLGIFGINNFTAIINPPESAILSISSVRKRPWVVTDENGEDTIAIRPLMNIQLSVDHRIVDGLLASQFIAYLKELLEGPIKILM